MSEQANSPDSEPTLVIRDEATAPVANETTLADVKQLGLWAAIASLSYVFWVVGGMEMVERLAYYGVRAVATIYVTRPADRGGLAQDMAAYGCLRLFLILTQSWVLLFAGGWWDPFGYEV